LGPAQGGESGGVSIKLWSIFSVYGEGAKQGINGDKFNLVKTTLQPSSQRRF
jgi:hypothetical protein